MKFFVHKGKKIAINPKVKTREEIESTLNNLQLAHLRGELDVYEPIKAYSEKWTTKFKQTGYWEDFESASPVPGSRVRSDLPPLYMQWKDAARAR